jgi:CheY-like chemotaxis protein
VLPEDLRGVHVLVVEDNDDSREALHRILGYCGALVTTAASIEEAHRILETLRPHVLVTDLEIPNDGLSLIRLVRAIAESGGTHIPAIAMTADRGERGELRAEGFAEFLEKPLDPIELCRVVRRHARLRRARPGWES